MSQNPNEIQRETEELEELQRQVKVEILTRSMTMNEAMDAFEEARLISDNCVMFTEIAAVDLQRVLEWLKNRK